MNLCSLKPLKNFCVKNILLEKLFIKEQLSWDKLTDRTLYLHHVLIAVKYVNKRSQLNIQLQSGQNPAATQNKTLVT